MGDTKRTTNPRGRGAALREEILAAVTRLLAARSSGEVTLRSIAREAGIAAPSIYPHFADRDAILDAVVARTFDELAGACSAAADGASSGTQRMHAVCDAYIAFARAHPGSYRILFERSAANLADTPRPYAAGIRAFDLLVDALCRMVADGTSTSTDPVADAQALWAALHGLVTLRPATPAFPWNTEAEIVVRLTTSLAHITPP